MARLLSSATFVFLAWSVAAQAFSFGEPVPLSNTRYGSTTAESLLRTDGESLFAFWASNSAIRMTRVVDGARRGGLPVVTVDRQDGQFLGFDAVWTGTHFLVAAAIRSYYEIEIVTRTVSATGEILTPPLTVVAQGAESPSLAFNGRRALLVYRVLRSDGVSEIRALPLSPDGRPIAASAFVANGVDAVVAGRENGFAALMRTRETEILLATFDSGGRPQLTFALPMPGGVDDLAIAANGDTYLGIFTGLAEVSAIRFTSLGQAGPPLIVDSREPSIYRYGYIGPAATWNGSEWAVTYTITDFKNPWQLVAATVDRETTRVTSRQVVEHARSAGIAAIPGRTVVAVASPSGNPSVPELLDLPLGGPAREFTFKAGDQHLVASASSGDAILVVWREWLNAEWTLRAGIRRASGEWIERKLPGNYAAAVAASTGDSFAILSRDAKGPVAWLLDRDLRLETQVALPFTVESAASNGEVYVLLAGGTAVTLSPSGQVGVPVHVGTATAHYAEAVVASDGDGFLITGLRESNCEYMLCSGGHGLLARRYDSSLRPVDAQNITITEGWAYNDGPSVAWNGSSYVISWTEAEHGQFAALVPRAAGSPVTKLLTAKAGVRETQVVPVRDGVVIHGRDTFVAHSYVDRVLYVDADGNVVEHEPIEHPGVVSGATRMETFADGRLAYLVSRTIADAPQHAATHLTMTVEAFGQRPGAPDLTATVNQRTVKLAWTDPAGAENGYRVEYRIEDGAWNELEQWFDAGLREASYTLSFVGQRVAFRVRAWSDAGTGPYSQPAHVNAPRRRSVR